MRRCGIATLLLLMNAPAQDAASATDWSDSVNRACTSRRYGLRLAAARKIGNAGDQAIPAVRAFAAEHGHNAIVATLVEAIADRGGNGEAVLDLLEEWSRDRDFFWRAQALRGLALRAEDAAIGARFAPLFADHVDDPAWLTRVYARWGSGRVSSDAGGTPTEFRAESDPRARTKLAALQGDAVGALPALADYRSFFGNPWGRHRAGEAHRFLQESTGHKTPYQVRASYTENRAAIDQLIQLVRERTAASQPIPEVRELTDPEVGFVGGIEILSCRNGDLFLRWTANGQIYSGLASTGPIQIPQDKWRQLMGAATGFELPNQSGVVICDKMRIVRPTADNSLVQSVVAPNALPTTVADWLKQLAAAIEETGNRELAVALRDRLGQFAIR